MLNIEAVRKVLDKRAERGATNQQLINYLESLKKGGWKSQPKIMEGFIFL